VISTSHHIVALLIKKFSMFTATDHAMMSQALKLAAQGLYTTTPNPRVGCVIVKDGVIVGQGAHLRAGEPHAEVYALREAGAQAHGADVYVTLEPCSHFGRTPPCADALLKAGVRRVIAAMQDPNPKVAGTGLAKLKAQGIEVASGLMAAEAQALNPGFISRMTRNRPYVRTKVAASLDGRTALANGESKWITGEDARRDVQHWRASSCAILTGVGTVLADDPLMNVRELDIGRQPLRVIVDSQLRTPGNARVLQDRNVLIAYANATDARIDALRTAGAALIRLPDDTGRVSLERLLGHLAELQINELLVEAGQQLNGALVDQQLVDELVLYYAPILMGADARGMFALSPLASMTAKIHLDIMDIRTIGVDLRLQARLLKK
jgi:diaminohydroxyphosphoribosylaminopyrimidine deaminase/5-amino-6-(5-phosphoribosylamino)uracil reductase